LSYKHTAINYDVRRAAIVSALRAIVPGEGVIEGEVGRRAYESDALTAYRTLPMVVVLPETTAQVVGDSALLQP
jgi:glycolate oxidase